jgi:hypothetical protein
MRKKCWVDHMEDSCSLCKTSFKIPPSRLLQRVMEMGKKCWTDDMEDSCSPWKTNFKTTKSDGDGKEVLDRRRHRGSCSLWKTNFEMPLTRLLQRMKEMGKKCWVDDMTSIKKQ